MSDQESNNLVVKDNALINASYYLGLAEQRLILLAIVEARKTNTSHDQFLSIHASSYARQFHTDIHSAYERLFDAAKNLFEREFTYKYVNKKGNWVLGKSRWVQTAEYIDKEARVKIKFTDSVLSLISVLEQRFTSYELEQISKLSSVYAIRLYEIVIAWKKIKKTPVFPIQELKENLGIHEDEYTRMYDFKKNVIDLAVKQINKTTDIEISYEQYKDGRNITGFSFAIKLKEGDLFTVKKVAKEKEIISIKKWLKLADELSKEDKENKIVATAFNKISKKYILMHNDKIIENWVDLDEILKGERD